MSVKWAPEPVLNLATVAMRWQQAPGYLEAVEGVLESQNVSQFWSERVSLVRAISGCLG